MFKKELLDVSCSDFMLQYLQSHKRHHFIPRMSTKPPPGDSSRDLFIPDRWMSLSHLKGVTFPPSQKGHVNCRIARAEFFFSIDQTLSRLTIKGPKEGAHGRKIKLVHQPFSKTSSLLPTHKKIGAVVATQNARLPPFLFLFRW